MEYEDNDWMAAFNLTLSVAGMYELLFNWFVDIDSSSQVGVVYHDHSPDTTNSSTSGSNISGSGGSFTIVRSVEDGYEPTGLQVDDRRELYFNTSEPIVMEAEAGATLTGTSFCVCPLDPTSHFILDMRFQFTGSLIPCDHYFMLISFFFSFYIACRSSIQESSTDHPPPQQRLESASHNG